MIDNYKDALETEEKGDNGMRVSDPLDIIHYDIKLNALEVKRVEEAMKIMNDKELNLYLRQMGCEPGSHNRVQRIDRLRSDIWWSEQPNIDIRHKDNLSGNRWSKDQFRNPHMRQNWKEAWEIPFWGKTKGRFNEILESI